MFSPFNPYKCTHTWSSGQPTLQRSGSSWGSGALLKGLTSVVDKSCRSRDSNPQPQVTSPTLYPFGFLWQKGWDLSPYSMKMLTSGQVLLAALLRVEFMRETMCRSLMLLIILLNRFIQFTKLLWSTRSREELIQCHDKSGPLLKSVLILVCNKD